MNDEVFLKGKVFHISFIKDKIENVQDQLGGIICKAFIDNWKKQSFELAENTFSELNNSGDFKTNVRCLLWEPEWHKENIVAFLTNIPDGWPTVLNNYFSKYKRETIKVALCDPNIKFPFYFYEQMQSKSRRVILVQKEEDGWQFFQEGAYLNFEKPEYYSKRRLKDRLNNEIIKMYLQYNDINIDDVCFWSSVKHAILYSLRFGGGDSVVRSIP